MDKQIYRGAYYDPYMVVKEIYSISNSVDMPIHFEQTKNPDKDDRTSVTYNVGNSVLRFEASSYESNNGIQAIFMEKDDSVVEGLIRNITGQ